VFITKKAAYLSFIINKEAQNQSRVFGSSKEPNFVMFTNKVVLQKVLNFKFNYIIQYLCRSRAFSAMRVNLKLICRRQIIENYNNIDVQLNDRTISQQCQMAGQDAKLYKFHFSGSHLSRTYQPGMTNKKFICSKI